LPLTAVNQRSSPAVASSTDRDNRIFADRRKDDIDHSTTDGAVLPSNCIAYDGGKIRAAQFDRNGNSQPSVLLLLLLICRKLDRFRLPNATCRIRRQVEPPSPPQQRTEQATAVEKSIS
jgi:hypothetical protein